MKTTVGELESVPIREVWPDEARDLTPGLAGNLEALGSALGTWSWTDRRLQSDPSAPIRDDDEEAARLMRHAAIRRMKNLAHLAESIPPVRTMNGWLRAKGWLPFKTPRRVGLVMTPKQGEGIFIVSTSAKRNGSEELRDPEAHKLHDYSLSSFNRRRGDIDIVRTGKPQPPLWTSSHGLGRPFSQAFARMTDEQRRDYFSDLQGMTVRWGGRHDRHTLPAADEAEATMKMTVTDVRFDFGTGTGESLAKLILVETLPSMATRHVKSNFWTAVISAVISVFVSALVSIVFAVVLG